MSAITRNLERGVGSTNLMMWVTSMTLRSRVALVVAVVVLAPGIAACGTPRVARSGVMAWGANDYGQLGGGTTAGPDRCSGGLPCGTTPAAVRGLSGVTAIAAGPDHNLALLSNGTVMAWGENTYGELGDGASAGPGNCSGLLPCSATPVEVRGLRGVTAIAAGLYFSLALLSKGTVMAWGLNDYGQLADGTKSGPSTCSSGAPCSTRAAAVRGLHGVTALAAGSDHSLALLSNGTVMAWGLNTSGQLGNGGTAGTSTPVPVRGLHGVRAIAAGSDYNVALLSNNTIVTWGDNAYGQLGDGTTTSRSTPVAVRGLTGVTAIAAGSDHNLALLSNGMVVTWGENTYGELGDATTSGPSVCSSGLPCSTTPKAMSGLPRVTAIAAGQYFSLALLSNGRLMAWGLNNYGQLGNGGMTSSARPVAVKGLTGVISVVAAGEHSVAKF